MDERIANDNAEMAAEAARLLVRVREVCRLDGGISPTLLEDIDEFLSGRPSKDRVERFKEAVSDAVDEAFGVNPDPVRAVFDAMGLPKVDAPPLLRNYIKESMDAATTTDAPHSFDTIKPRDAVAAAIERQTAIIADIRDILRAEL
jgi:hypothetical protein